MNYEEDIKIDETALDVEWLEQPSLMMKYARHAAEARRDADLAKENLDIVKAGLDNDIRTAPDDYKVVKVTDASVAAAILAQPDYKKANRRLVDARYEADIASAAVRAIEQRKDALENLVRLHGQQYFAGPKMPRDLSFEVRQAESTRSANSAIKSRMARKTRREDDDD